MASFLSACSKMDFYPRPPRGGRQYRLCPSCMAKLFLSTPSARRATRLCHNLAQLRGFLSTPSARRATHLSAVSRLSHPNFYPRPPRGGRPHRSTRLFSSSTISIHALREEGDYCRDCQRNHTWRFLSTPSARRATTVSSLYRSSGLISIHALREEGDYNSLNGWATDIKFLSTPSARRATKLVEQRPRRHYISIHALREEGDSSSSTRTWGPSNFYPRPPRGGRRRHRRATGCETTDFYPRPPRGGRPDSV